MLDGRVLVLNSLPPPPPPPHLHFCCVSIHLFSLELVAKVSWSFGCVIVTGDILCEVKLNSYKIIGH